MRTILTLDRRGLRLDDLFFADGFLSSEDFSSAANETAEVLNFGASDIFVANFLFILYNFVVK